MRRAVPPHEKRPAIIFEVDQLFRFHYAALCADTLEAFIERFHEDQFSAVCTAADAHDRAALMNMRGAVTKELTLSFNRCGL